MQIIDTRISKNRPAELSFRTESRGAFLTFFFDREREADAEREPEFVPEARLCVFPERLEDEFADLLFAEVIYSFFLYWIIC